MTLEIVLISICLAVSLFNLAGLIMLSNSIFRLIAADRSNEPVAPTARGDTGLVDP